MSDKLREQLIEQLDTFLNANVFNEEKHIVDVVYYHNPGKYIDLKFKVRDRTDDVID